MMGVIPWRGSLPEVKSLRNWMTGGLMLIVNTQVNTRGNVRPRSGVLTVTMPFALIVLLRVRGQRYFGFCAHFVQPGAWYHARLGFSVQK